VADAVPAGVETVYAPVRDEVPGIAASLARPGVVVLTLGAGDVTGLGPLILERLAGCARPRPAASARAASSVTPCPGPRGIASRSGPPRRLGGDTPPEVRPAAGAGAKLGGMT